MDTRYGFIRVLRLPVLVALLALVVPSDAAFSQSGPVQPSSVVYEGFRNVRTNGDDSTWGQGLTHRYVDESLRFLTLAHPGMLHEFQLADAGLGGTITRTTATWNLANTDALNNFNGLWFEQAKNRLWIASGPDYTANYQPAKITLLALGANGAVSVLKQFFLSVPGKRVYGGCNAVPAALVARLGGPYVCGWGGYTSLVAQGGGASIGPTMYAIPDPDTIQNGATVTVRTILDAATSRGVRKTLPTNYFDGGDPRQNPSSRPTAPPQASAQWLSPNSDGLGWMTWGDSYYNTGTWIGTTYAAVASLCKGACWYQSSTLAFDGRQFELHLWDGAALGDNPLRRPTSMTELALPIGWDRVWGGNIPTGNIAGATFDPVSGRLYLIGFPLGGVDIGRLYSFVVAGMGGSASGPPVDAVVSEWSGWTSNGEWSTCRSGLQLLQEERTRAVLAPATGGGFTPALRETRTSSRDCSGAARPGRLQGELVATGLDRPVGIIQHPTDAQVQLIIRQDGRVQVLRDTLVDPVDFLDLSQETAAGGERGLLGLAFAPDFAQTGRVFVSFTNRSGHSVISRFVRSAADPGRLDAASRFDLRWPNGERFITQPFTNHNGGHLAFGPDGYLYVGFGDGGSSNDPLGVAQHPMSLLGKMLRLDVSVPDSDDRGYRIPPSNPFIGRGGVLPEIWALGLRNPWRWSFDDPGRGGTGALIVADVGQNRSEEINYEPAGLGGRNYGWPHREGRHANAPGTPFPTPMTEPLWAYDHDTGRSIIGGYVYRGTALGSAHVGRYFFADYVTNRIWSLAIVPNPSTGEGIAGALIDHTSDLASAAASPVSFGTDATGELYVVSYLGSIYRVESVGSDASRPRSGSSVGTARPR